MIISLGNEDFHYKYIVIMGENVAQSMLELAQKKIKNTDIFESDSLQKF
jgi:hypothetical protein